MQIPLPVESQVGILLKPLDEALPMTPEAAGRHVLTRARWERFSQSLRNGRQFFFPEG